MIEWLAMLLHPARSSMVRWRDREGGSLLDWWLRAHMAQCERCSRDYRELVEVSAALDRTLTGTVPDKSILIEGRRRLVDEMRMHRETPYPLTGELLDVVVEQIQRCLGGQAASEVARRARLERDGRKVIYSLEPAMSALLGARTAAEWQRRVLETMSRVSREKSA